MKGITILIWITIAIIAIISIIVVRLHYKGNELEKDERSIIPSGEALNNAISSGKNFISSHDKFSTRNNNFQRNQPASLGKANSSNTGDYGYIIPEVENDSPTTYEYESQNQILVNYGNTVEKFQEPINQNQMDIMTQNNKDAQNEKHELKDLFTIDELIKESKRKDSEREKESQKIDHSDEDLDEIKESIKQKQENNYEEKLIEDILEEDNELIEEIVDEDKKENESDLNNVTSNITDAIEESEPVSDKIPTVTSQDIEKVINTASQESEESVESISEDTTITDTLLDKPEETTEEVIKEPVLKTPKKVGEDDYEFGANLNVNEVFGNNEEYNELDYRNDLAKITNTIKESKIFQDVKEKLKPDVAEEETDETYIRNVNDYQEEFEPIINETHADYEATYEDYHKADYDQRLRQENTRRVFNMAKNSPEPELAEPRVGQIKDIPARDNIKIQINNNEYVLKKGDEIIFNHSGETYSSQVYAINGDNISVKYRRKNITIKPDDVKKIY